jgi:amino-acid N-acetyltransferase
VPRPPTCRALAQDVALLTSLGVRLVLVYGCRPQIEAQLAAAGMDSASTGDTRITDADAMPLLQAVVGAQRIELEALLSMGLPNSPMQGAQLRACGGNFVTADPSASWTALTHQLTGACVASTAAHRSTARRWQRGPPVRAGLFAHRRGLQPEPRGRRHQRPARARRRQADSPRRVRRGRVRGHGCCASASPARWPWSLSRCAAAVAAGDAYRACRPACRAATSSAIAIRDALLTELFTTDGSGTLVSRRALRTVALGQHRRCRRHRRTDRPAGGERRAAEALAGAARGGDRRFRVLERDGRVIACAALYPFPEAGSAELACIVSHPEYRGAQRAQRLLTELEAEALAQGLAREVFVLTTQTAHWFIEQGLRKRAADTLPPQRQALYNLQRNSKVLAKDLSRGA